MADYYECGGVITKGKLRLRDKGAMDRALASWKDGDILCRIERPTRHRTGPQNRFWHGVVIPLFAEHCGYRESEMKDVLALKLIPVQVLAMDGTERTVPGHTSTLSVAEFNDLISQAQQLGAEMDILIPDPEAV